jgi:Domain of unknown function (DUF3885)
MSDDFDLPAFLERHFPPLAWPQIMSVPVFYRWPIALRFELGGRDNLRTVYARATTLYEAAFAPEDNCVVAAGRFIQRIPPPRIVVPAQPAHDLFGFAAMEGLDLGPALQRKEVIECGSADPYDEGTWILEWTSRPPRSFGYERILQGLANCDHLIEPWIDDRVYFVAPRKGLLFYMYDDRGLDMIATDRSVLVPLYRGFDRWLLDHDRARMRETFGDAQV